MMTTYGFKIVRDRKRLTLKVGDYITQPSTAMGSEVMRAVATKGFALRQATPSEFEEWLRRNRRKNSPFDLWVVVEEDTQI